MKDAGYGIGFEDGPLEYRNLYHVDTKLTERFIVSGDFGVNYAALGCLISLIAPCWSYARKTGRTLVVDWRGSPYTRNWRTFDLFSALYSLPDGNLGGVPLLAGDAMNQRAISGPVLVSDQVCDSEHGMFGHADTGYPVDEMRRALRFGEDLPGASVIPSMAAIFPGTRALSPLSISDRPSFSFEEGQLVFSGLVPNKRVQACVQGFLDEAFSGQPVIGLHVREGNGEEAYRSHFANRTIEHLDEFLDAVINVVRQTARNRGFLEYQVFVCSDSQKVISYLQSSLSNVITYPRPYLEDGQGMDFDQSFRSIDDGVAVAEDALIDMHILAACDHFIQTRESAFAYQVPFLLKEGRAAFTSAVAFDQQLSGALG